METIHFPKVRAISKTAMNILKKRYFLPHEKTWEELVDRVIEYVIGDKNPNNKELMREMIANRYFIPNSPCLVNSGKPSAGLSACFVVDFQDDTIEIFKTKLEFALIARKGGGCGTTLSKIRPEGSFVSRSTHGYAGGPVKFADTISHDADALTQSGFRAMAIMFTMSIYHPDIIKFITAKTEEGRIENANMSVVVDDNFMNAVKENKTYWTEFNGEKYTEYKAKDIFDMIVEGAWKNGEPGILFKNRIDDSPYQHTGQEILATNPCSEQPLPPNGVCNLGSLDLSKFVQRGEMNYEQLALATILSVDFLDSVVDASSYPTEPIAEWAEKNRAIGLGIMGFADYCLQKKIAYGSEESIEKLKNILSFIYAVAEIRSYELGSMYGFPYYCQMLPKPRRNITLLTVAPTGTVSLLAGCSSGIEPIFSEITLRNDKTGSYTFENDLADKEYFRCAVSSNGAKEVTWEEHIDILSAAQEYVDSGVSKTINFPHLTRRETIGKAIIMAWEKGCKGLAIYRNGSRKIEVLSPKNLKKDKCPVCGKNDLVEINGKLKCPSCIDPSEKSTSYYD